jgi:DNA-binding transcriptional LysR family regulator
MSSTLARLRKLLADPLLVRDGRELVATPYAESLVKPVREVLDGVEAILACRTEFDPARAQRSFAVIASDYTMITFLTPLLAQLGTEAPGVHLWVSSPGDGYEERLRRGRVDLVIMPREVFVAHRDFPHQFLFQDRFVCAVDADNYSVGGSISLEEFSSLPYLATSCGHEVSPAEAQLDMLGIARNTEVTTAFGLAPLRLLEPPMPLQPINQLMLWTSRVENDPGHQWLRRRIAAFAEERDEAPHNPVRA